MTSVMRGDAGGGQPVVFLQRTDFLSGETPALTRCIVRERHFLRGKAIAWRDWRLSRDKWRYSWGKGFCRKGVSLPTTPPEVHDSCAGCGETGSFCRRHCRYCRFCRILQDALQALQGLRERMAARIAPALQGSALRYCRSLKSFRIFSRIAGNADIAGCIAAKALRYCGFRIAGGIAGIAGAVQATAWASLTHPSNRGLGDGADRGLVEKVYLEETMTTDRDWKRICTPQTTPFIAHSTPHPERGLGVQTQ